VESSRGIVKRRESDGLDEMKYLVSMIRKSKLCKVVRVLTARL
jgi:hypothetical protein